MSAPARHPAAQLDADTFREAMSWLPTAVSIVTTTDGRGHRWGFTAGSVGSVSLDPPLLLVGVDNGSSCLEAMTGSHEFAVNVLGERHRELAALFARHGADRFDGTAGHAFGPWPGSQDGPPLLAGANAAYRCTTVESVPAGDHHLVIGRLTGLVTREQAEPPLVWYRRAFVTTGDLQQ
ncbi:flavin reductase family protein [Streptomyces griseorubiginosus]|uniref:flavin reductase family protein n=1 Tax=Streptomyces griseorubiginosus TaxID=67304 RepID=UPI00332244FB